MGFKIESISTMTTIANNLSTLANDASARFSQTSAAIDALVSNVEGQGVDVELNKLRESIVSSGATTVNLLNEVSSFINSQATAYASNEETVAQELTNIESDLEGLVI